MGYEINEKQIYFPSSGLVFDYRATPTSLTLSDESGTATIVLRRVEEPTS